MISSRDHRPRELNDAITLNWVIGVLRYTRRAVNSAQVAPIFCNKSQVAQDKVLHLRYFRGFSGDDDFATARKADGIIKGINRTRTHSLRPIDNGMRATRRKLFFPACVPSAIYPSRFVRKFLIASTSGSFKE